MSVHLRNPEDGDPAGADRLLADAAHAAHDASARLAAALIDLFLHDAHRPTDRQRATMTRMLGALIAGIEGALRMSLIEALGDLAPPALAVPRIVIAVPILERARTLRDGDLVALLLARSEEHRIVDALKRIAEADPDPPAALSSEAIGDAALDQALLRAENRRIDRFGEPTLGQGDLSAELLHRLVWRIAAALRHYLLEVGRIDDVLVDDALIASVTGILTRHDEGETVEARAMQLARAIPLDDERLRAALDASRFSLFVAMLAVRAGVDHGAAFAMATDPAIGRLTVLLRATGVERDTAAAILFEMAAINGLSEDALGDRVDDFSALGVDEARAAIRLWRLDRGYRSSIAELAAGMASAA